jgi:hypothetical protein
MKSQEAVDQSRKLCASLLLIGVNQPARAFVRSDCFSFRGIHITVDESTASGSNPTLVVVMERLMT